MQEDVTTLAYGLIALVVTRIFDWANLERNFQGRVELAVLTA